jgi:multiple RNA-binding domain-containing protein 1
MESSRIFIRGLPAKFSEDDVRNHFSKFPVTDVKFFPHRRIGYVGYKTPEDAAKAVKYFNKTFIKLTKIYCETARPVCTVRSWRRWTELTLAQIADKELPKSRRQLKSEKNAPRTDEWRPPPRQENELKRKRDEAEQDPKLKEFLEVYQPPSKNSIWANGDGQPGGATVAAAEETVPEVAVPEDDESDGEYQVIASKKLKTAQEPTTTPVVVAPTPAEEPSNEQVPDRADIDAVMEDVQEAHVAEQAVVSDADWLRSRTNRVLELIQDDEVPATTIPAPQAPISQAPHAERVEVIKAAPESRPVLPVQEGEVVDAAQAEEDKIRETGRLYLRNLSFDITEDELREQFSKHGELEEVSEIFFSRFAHPMMNIKIGTTDASAPEVTLESILVDVFLI